MKIPRIIILCFCLLTVASVSYCEELTQEKKDAIKELMNITGSIQLGELLGNTVVQQMMNLLKNTHPEIPPRALEIIQAEVMTLIREETGENGSFQQIIYPIYNKYLTLEEIREFIRFYKTPIGKKAMSVLPEMMQEAVQAGQAWALSLGPKIERRVLTRLEEEGIKTNK